MKILAGGDSWALLVVLVTEWPSGRDENAMFRHPRNAEEKSPEFRFTQAERGGGKTITEEFRSDSCRYRRERK